MISLFKNRIYTWMLLFLATVILCGSVGCHTWKRPQFRNPFSKNPQQNRKQLEDAPLYNGGSEDLINHAEYLRNPQPTAQTEKKPPKKWYQPPFLMSSEAAEINDHLGK